MSRAGKASCILLTRCLVSDAQVGLHCENPRLNRPKGRAASSTLFHVIPRWPLPSQARSGHGSSRAVRLSSYTPTELHACTHRKTKGCPKWHPVAYLVVIIVFTLRISKCRLDRLWTRYRRTRYRRLPNCMPVVLLDYGAAWLTSYIAIKLHCYQAIGPLGYAWGRIRKSFRCPNRWRDHAGGIVIEEIMRYVGRNAPIRTVESKGTTVEEHITYIRGS